MGAQEAMEENPPHPLDAMVEQGVRVMVKLVLLEAPLQSMGPMEQVMEAEEEEAHAQIRQAQEERGDQEWCLSILQKQILHR